MGVLRLPSNEQLQEYGKKVSCGLVVVKGEYTDNAFFSCALVFAVSWDLQEWELPLFFLVITFYPLNVHVQYTICSLFST